MVSKSEFDSAYFGKVLQEIRRRVGLTAREVAIRANLAASTYHRYENGQTDSLPFAETVRIGLVLGLSPNELAALAGLWSADAELDEEAGIREWRAVMSNALLKLPESARRVVMDITVDMVRLQADALQRREAELEDEAGSVLPVWLRRRISADLTSEQRRQFVEEAELAEDEEELSLGI